MMGLLDSFKEYVKAYRKLQSEVGEDFEGKLIEIIAIFNSDSVDKIQKYELLDGDKDVHVVYDTHGWGEYYTEEIIFPAYLLDMSRIDIISEYKKITEERRKEDERRVKLEKEKAKREKEKRAKERAAKKEIKERKEYERLKKKYGG